MSRSTFSILPYINRQKVKADGTANILCRITVDGKIENVLLLIVVVLII